MRAASVRLDVEVERLAIVFFWATAGAGLFSGRVRSELDVDFPGFVGFGSLVAALPLFLASLPRLSAARRAVAAEANGAEIPLELLSAVGGLRVEEFTPGRQLHLRQRARWATHVLLILAITLSALAIVAALSGRLALRDPAFFVSVALAGFAFGSWRVLVRRQTGVLMADRDRGVRFHRHRSSGEIPITQIQAVRLRLNETKRIAYRRGISNHPILRVEVASPGEMGWTTVLQSQHEPWSSVRAQKVFLEQALSAILGVQLMADSAAEPTL